MNTKENTFMDLLKTFVRGFIAGTLLVIALNTFEKVITVDVTQTAVSDYVAGFNLKQNERSE